MTLKPPIALPSNQTPPIDIKTGVWKPSWYAFFAGLVAAAPPIKALVVGASPFTYTAVHIGALLVVGGTVTSIVLTRARVTLTTGLTAGFIPMSQGDQAVVTYTVLPTMWYIPNGNPA